MLEMVKDHGAGHKLWQPELTGCRKHSGFSNPLAVGFTKRWGRWRFFQLSQGDGGILRVELNFSGAADKVRTGGGDQGRCCKTTELLLDKEVFQALCLVVSDQAAGRGAAGGSADAHAGIPGRIRRISCVEVFGGIQAQRTAAAGKAGDNLSREPGSGIAGPVRGAGESGTRASRRCWPAVILTGVIRSQRDAGNLTHLKRLGSGPAPAIALLAHPRSRLLRTLRI